MGARGLVNVLLALVCVGMVAGVLVLLDRSRVEDRSRLDRFNARQTAVTEAATRQTEAFLTVDHRRMDELMTTVSEGATGSFAASYAARKSTLKASAVANHAMSRPSVLAVGVGELSDDDAVVLVAADAAVSNRATKGVEQPRVYRLRLRLERIGEDWLTSELGYVG